VEKEKSRAAILFPSDDSEREGGVIEKARRIRGDTAKCRTWPSRWKRKKVVEQIRFTKQKRGMGGQTLIVITSSQNDRKEEGVMGDFLDLGKGGGRESCARRTEHSRK